MEDYMTRSELMQNYWRYYLMLEKKFLNTLTYVELSTQNFDTYSNEFAHLLQAIGAELDAFFKVYCGFNPTDRKTITDYANFVLQDYPDITTQEIEVQGYQLSFIPFDGWDASRASQSLNWWFSFDQIKHSRVANMTNASLKNVMHILGGLYLLEIKYLEKITRGTDDFDIPDGESTIFDLKNWSYRHASLGIVVAQVIDEAIVIDDGSAFD